MHAAVGSEQQAAGTDETIVYGDSALDEMCTAAVYRYPADNTLFFCHDR